MQTYRYGAAALAVAIALAGCSAATTTTKPDPEPAAPSLLGTWEFTLDPDDHGEARHRVLTFRPNRYVVVVTERDASGAIIGTDNDSGGWEQFDTHLTKIYLDDEADNAAVSVPKRYTLTADTLTVQEWVNNAADARDITYTRVTDPAILTTLAGGSWVRESEEEHEGNLEPWRWTITAVPDGKFTYTFEDPRHLFEMTGSWTDDTANRTIIVTVETVPAAQSNWIGYPLLFAYAPNGAPDRINVSLFIVEQMWNSDQQQWQAPNDGTPYGGYGLVMDRVMPLSAARRPAA